MPHLMRLGYGFIVLAVGFLLLGVEAADVFIWFALGCAILSAMVKDLKS